MKEWLLVICAVLILWSNKDRLPPEYQFWRQNETLILVVNQSDRDITGTRLVVWSKPHPLGDIKKGRSKEFRIVRQRDVTEVVIRFKYGEEVIERHAGTLDQRNEYRMTIFVHFAGIVLTQVGGTAGELLDEAPPVR